MVEDSAAAASAGDAAGQMDNTVPISLKVLASHLGVGAIIGKAGHSIAEIQQASECKIQISGNHDVFPGTTERVMNLSGEMLKVMSALHMIMQKWKTESVFKDLTDMDSEHVQLRIVMLGKLCGAIIGEGGRSINEIKAATDTEIRIQSRDECVRGVSERIITILGDDNQVLQAVGRILKKVLEDPAYEEYRTLSLVSMSSGSMQGVQNLRMMPDDPLAAVPCHFTLQLTNEQAGAVLGRGGSNIGAILKMSGAKVSIQSRNEVAEGGLRSCDIQGHLDSCGTALQMVVSKLRETSRRRDHDDGGERRYRGPRHSNHDM